MNAIVSIIIPVYNREDVIAECIHSVLSQTYPHFQIILIDDGSTDNTAEICRAFAQQHPQISLLESGHAGVSAARNLGLDAAQGTYVFFLDSDDVIHPSLLENLVTGMQDSGAEMGGTQVLTIHHANWHSVSETIAKDSGLGEVSYHTHEETLSAIFRSITPLNMIGGVMMRRDLIGETRFREDLYIGEDFYFIYQNLVKGSSSVFLKQKRYYARIHKQNISWDYRYEGFWTRFYRRQLVWENEESQGRLENAIYQKRDGFSCFLRCISRNAPYCQDSRRMRQTIKTYKGILLPALSATGKLRFYLSVYFPATYFVLNRGWWSLKKWYHHRKKHSVK